MSDRVATRAADMRHNLKELYQDTENADLRVSLSDAAQALKEAEEIDRELRGSTPEDALAAHIENTDECPNCGEPLDEGGWCSMSCMREHLGEDGDS